MDSSLAIEATNLSKKYRLGTIGMSSLREDLSRWWSRNTQSSSTERNVSTADIDQSRMINESEFWALDDLNFQIPKGEVVGLIGANGSGKSTLLKILSRITEPTLGEVKIRGKVASLLEVGTGFHPELTGRENVYINGAILGMTRREVDAKFDEIVGFAGVSDFIDTPIKRYSSGMTVRLGFAVAAHLDPDILIVDEVLAVGDAAFQKRCLGKIENISKEGRTIIFVSHQLTMIENLCSKTFLLERGQITDFGLTNEIVNTYLKKSYHGINNLENVSWESRQGSGEVQLKKITIKSHSLGLTNNIKLGERADFIFHFHTLKENYPLPEASFRFAINDYEGRRITTIDSRLVNFNIIKKDNIRIIVKLKKINFPEGTYFITTFIGESETPYDWITKAHVFNVVAGDFYGTGRSSETYKNEILMDYEMDMIDD